MAKGNGRIKLDPARGLTPEEKVFMVRCLQAEDWGVLSDEAREICRMLIEKMKSQQNYLGGPDDVEE